MSKHTKGPWVFIPEKLYDGHHIAGRGPQVQIGDSKITFLSGKDEDAQLTSAAPELLEELKTMIDIIEKGAETFQDQEDLIKYAKTIIAKAEGGSL